MQTEIVSARSPNECDKAVALLRAGEIVALPTETVYGLAADALNPEAVAKIFEAKERPRFDPLIVHLPARDWLERVAQIDAGASSLVVRLIQRFWPGPLTILLPKTDLIPDIVTAGLTNVAVRMSAHPVFAAIARELDRPLAAPSANRFGRVSPTTAAHVSEELDGRIPLIVDAGATEHGLESTIVRVGGNRLTILREGPITREVLAEFGEVDAETSATRPNAPGQLASHYAPRTPLVIAENISQFAPPAHQRCGALLWSSAPFSETFVESRRLSTTNDLREAAANLFREMRELDRAGLDLIVAEAVPEKGLGVAIMDRLRRAAHR
ncbi:MAG TPA: L-threonylcarbamoyladenylate synthase [Chthoniobacterales bacterium]